MTPLLQVPEVVKIRDRKQKGDYEGLGEEQWGVKRLVGTESQDCEMRKFSRSAAQQCDCP